MLSRPDLTFTRPLPVSRADAYALWTEPFEMRRWFGWEGCETVSVTSEPRPGGAFGWAMRCADGREFKARGSYWEVVEGSRLMLHDRLTDFRNRPLIDALTMVDFHAGIGGHSLIGVRSIVTRTHRAARRLPPSGMQDAWDGLLDRFAAHCSRSGGQLETTDRRAMAATA